MGSDGQLFVNRMIPGSVNCESCRRKPRRRAPVPVVPALHELLEEHHRHCPNPKAGPIFASIFRDGHWTRISLDNLRTRQMLPALNRCKHCGLADGKKHLKEAKDGHKFERDPRIVAWRGWHCARSGVATTLDAFGVSLNVISRTLRHSNTSVTANHCIKPNLDTVSAGMRVNSAKK